MLRTKFASIALAAGVSLGLAAAVSVPAAQAADDFYKGKNIRVIIGYGPGGGYDIYARFVTRHMSRFIPGNPTMVPTNMPGAGSARAAQHLMVGAPQDGSVLATLGQNLPLDQALNPKKAKYDTRKLIWIGNANRGNNVVMIWHTAGINSIEDAKKKDVYTSATGVTSTSVQYPRVLNNMFGTRFKIISGFGGGRELNLAIERGEVQGRGSNAWASIKANTPHYIKDNLVKIILQMGLEREKDLPDVPLLIDLARNPAERRVLELISAGVDIGRPLVTTPGVPADRVKLLRGAFDATMKDPKFLAEAEKAKFDINPVSGEKVQKIVENIVSAPDDIVQLVKAAMTKGQVFDCKATVKDPKLCQAPKKKKKKAS
jgi:tripartite-type tricarboxylate transporter receptor subunit TctC